MVRFLAASRVFLSCCSLVLANTFCLSVSVCLSVLALLLPCPSTGHLQAFQVSISTG